jgi:hypothetical protein
MFRRTIVRYLPNYTGVTSQKKIIFFYISPTMNDRSREIEVIKENSSFFLFSCLTYYSTLKMETVCFPESYRFFRTTQRYNPQQRALQRETLRKFLCDFFVLVWVTETLQYLGTVLPAGVVCCAECSGIYSAVGAHFHRTARVGTVGHARILTRCERRPVGLVFLQV